MDGSEFSQVRRSLGKTQQQLAQVLGVSLKAVQSFEQGWRRIPVHVERQLLFLLYLRRGTSGEREPCWERKNCAPEVRAKCTAWEVSAGDLCWFINGTVCEGRVQTSWHAKMDLCRGCTIFRSSLGVPGGSADASPDDD